MAVSGIFVLGLVFISFHLKGKTLNNYKAKRPSHNCDLANRAKHFAESKAEIYNKIVWIDPEKGG